MDDASKRKLQIFRRGMKSSRWKTLITPTSVRETAPPKHGPSRKFLTCPADNFLLQRTEGESTFLGGILTSRKDLAEGVERARTWRKHDHGAGGVCVCGILDFEENQTWA